MLIRQGRQGQRKQFFFEKKNQKTFTHWGARRWRGFQEQQFFVSFFQKRNASL
jgi:hypothetical protein